MSLDDGRRGVFRSKQHLSPQYAPETPVGREREIDRLASVVETVTQRDPSQHVWVHGPAGVGKTSCVKHVLERLEAESGVKQVYINCWQYNRRSALITELLIQLGYPAVRRGKSVDELVSKLRIWLDRNRDVAVALDEVDQLQDRAEVIYDLQHVSEQAEHDVGLVLVSNQQPSEIDLDPRSQSRLSYQPLEFQPYSATELQQILEHRVDQGFHPDTVPEEVLTSVAETVAEQGGDCRQALELLLQAGRSAERDNAAEIKHSHLREAVESREVAE